MPQRKGFHFPDAAFRTRYGRCNCQYKTPASSRTSMTAAAQTRILRTRAISSANASAAGAADVTLSSGAGTSARATAVVEYAGTTLAGSDSFLVTITSALG